jgi:hypothetical protein
MSIEANRKLKVWATVANQTSTRDVQRPVRPPVRRRGLCGS